MLFWKPNDATPLIALSQAEYEEAYHRIKGIRKMSRKAMEWWVARPIYREGIAQGLAKFPDELASWVKTAPKEIPVVLPKGREIYSHQKEAIAYFHWLYKYRSIFTGSLLADEMGLGKTITAIVWANTFKPDGILVVAPAHLLTNWRYEIEKWQTLSYAIRIVKSPFEISKIKGRWLVVSYSSLKKVLTDVSKLDGKYLVIADESHYIKNSKTKRFKNFKERWKILDNGKSFLLMMTGTPITNLADDLFTTWSLLIRRNWQILTTQYKWDKRYTHWEHNGYGWQKVGNKNEAELHLRLSSTIMLQRSKEDVLDLPDKIYQYLPVELPKQLREEYEKALIEVIKDKKKLLASHIQAVMQRVALKKAETVIAMTKDIVAERGAVVVWAYHHSVVDFLYEMLSKEGLRVVKADGRDTDKVKQKAVEDFQAGKYDVFIAGLTAMNTGYTLTRAKTTIFAQTDFTPAHMRQAEDRIHRIGQDKDTLIIYLTADGTVESAVLQRWLKKEASQIRIVKGGKRQ